MSDQPMGPGWWQASDYKWYPPQPQPAYVPPPKQKSKIPLVIGIICIVIVVAFGGCALFGIVAVNRAVSATQLNNATVSETPDGKRVEGERATSPADDPAGTFRAPLPLGTEIDLDNGWQVKVSAVDLSPAVTDAIVAANPGSGATPGFRYVTADVRLTFVGDAVDTSAPASKVQLDLVATPGRSYPVVDILANPPQPVVDLSDIVAKGDVVSGKVVFFVPADTPTFVVRVAAIGIVPAEGWIAAS